MEGFRKCLTGMYRLKKQNPYKTATGDFARRVNFPEYRVTKAVQLVVSLPFGWFWLI